MSANPCFPKVYSVKVYQDAEGKTTYTANIEKLLKLKTLELPELKMIGNKYFTDYDYQVKQMMKAHDLPNATQKGAYEDAYKQIVYQIHLETLTNLIDHAIGYNSNPATNVKDTHLKQAIVLIRRMVKTSPEMTQDMHIDNAMIRRGPFAPQLVITDPVA